MSALDGDTLVFDAQRLGRLTLPLPAEPPAPGAAALAFRPHQIRIAAEGEPADADRVWLQGRWRRPSFWASLRVTACAWARWRWWQTSRITRAAPCSLPAPRCGWPACAHAASAICIAEPGALHGGANPYTAALVSEEEPMNTIPLVKGFAGQPPSAWAP